MDIEKFFDSVNQKKLIDLVAQEIADGRVLRLIQSFLRCGVMEEMKVEYRVTGTPQVGVISPLLANIYLHPYDEKMTQEGYKAVRFADDIIILCRSRIEAEKALRRTREILEGELSLQLNSQPIRGKLSSFWVFYLGVGIQTIKSLVSEQLRPLKIE